ncbi:efflux transporter outer membrane subunit [Methylomonas sp. SURF-1]|uniref:Efflux transporter outer membrane subunit n=1 Tax=Methylomonas aurea TaxID=2952224 RepID=A0ABT1UIN0_9GAMM|nr:efflux transporter outer membrane subunit [Methylomonas sp. SURF-1]MCQ8181534.1 efflux transporter outer membrane subunit [Methylomonas sp. SURF-1]
MAMHLSDSCAARGNDTTLIFRRLSLLGLAFLLTACAVGPDYQPPQPAMPERWTEIVPTASAAARNDLAEWWRGFNDDRLNRLVERALQGNLDLKAAEARILAARAQRDATDAERWPSVNASSAFQRQRISPNALLGALGSIQGGGQSNNGLLSTLGSIGTPFNLFQAGFDSSWELDLFGGIRRQQEAAEANAEAIADSQLDVQVSLIAEVARAYLELTALHSRLAIAEDNLKNQREILRLAEAGFQEGMATALDVQRATAELETAEGSVAPISAQIKNTRHALALLAGLPPAGLEGELAEVQAAIPVPPAVQPGMPSDLLRRRPDIRQAERTVASASASIGAAVAELFPKLSLTGAAGFQSQDLSNFTSLSSGFYGFGPRVSLPIFQAGRLLANIDAQEARHQEALMAYEKSVLAALREVEDGLSTLQGEHSRRLALESAVQSAKKAAETAEAYYSEGEADLSSVLDSRRSWHNAREQLLQSRLAWATGHVALYKALGGGW